MTASVHSPRLDLIPMTPAFLRASLKRDVQEAEQQLVVSLPLDWPGEHTDVLSLRLRQFDDEPALQPWLLRARFHGVPLLPSTRVRARSFHRLDALGAQGS
jgi:hypothetical protein